MGVWYSLLDGVLSFSGKSHDLVSLGNHSSNTIRS